MNLYFRISSLIFIGKILSEFKQLKTLWETCLKSWLYGNTTRFQRSIVNGEAYRKYLFIVAFVVKESSLDDTFNYSSYLLLV